MMKNLFMYFEDDSLILWDLVMHNQWELDKSIGTYLINSLLDSDVSKRSSAIEYLRKQGAYVSDQEEQWGWDILSYLFHTGTSNIPTNVDTSNATEWSANYQQFSDEAFEKVTGLHDYEPSETILKRTTSSSDIYRALSSRETNRKFLDKPLAKTTFELLIGCVFSYRETKSFSEFVTKHNISTVAYKRSAPSAGGLQSVDIFINVKNVSGLSTGIYFYNPIDNGITKISEYISDDESIELLNGQPFSARSAFDIIYVSRLDRLWNKYEYSRGYRAALLDVGHLSQNLLLCAAHEGLETYITGSLSDKNWSDRLKINLPSVPVFFASVGYGTKQFIPMEYFN
jgi:SagB-type dehydrogenase family enzyme